MELSRELMPLNVTLTPYILNVVALNILKLWMFELMKWMQIFYQSMWDYEILYADRSSKGKRLLIRSFLWKIKSTNVESVWK